MSNNPARDRLLRLAANAPRDYDPEREWAEFWAERKGNGEWDATEERAKERRAKEERARRQPPPGGASAGKAKHGLTVVKDAEAGQAAELEAEIDALEAELLDTYDLDNIPDLEPLIADVLFCDTVTRMYGPSESLKSFVALDMAGAVGTGMDWHGKPVQQGLVYYLVAEGSKGVRKRVRAWEQHHGRRMTGFKILPRPVQVKSREWRVLMGLCKRRSPALVVIDTQARVTVGVNEDSATDMGEVYELVEDLRRTCGACVLVIHHTGIGVTDRGRGTSAIKGAMQTELGVTRTGKKAKDTKVTLKTGKQKDDEKEDDLHFRVERITLEGEVDKNGKPRTSLVLVPEVAPDGFDVVDEELAAASASASRSIREFIRRLDEADIPNYGRENIKKECLKRGIRAP